MPSTVTAVHREDPVRLSPRWVLRYRGSQVMMPKYPKFCTEVSTIMAAEIRAVAA